MRQKGSAFFGHLVAVLKTSIISFSVLVLDIFKTSIAFGSVDINKIISGNISNFGDKNFKVEEGENDGNTDERNQAVDAGLA